MQQLWLVTVPNSKDSADSTHQTLCLNVPSSACKIHKFEMPNLVVGTLDSLMSLSDDLFKINAQVENVVRKVERQYLDVAGSQADLLRINSQPVESYLRNFQWDYARYQHSGRQLVDLVAQVQTMTATVDEELKKLSVMYNEKNLALSNLQRKKTINLATSDFEDFLSPEKVSRLDIFRADAEKFLETVFVVVPKGVEQEFLRTYHTIGANIVSYKSESGANAPIQGSPVCPDSAVNVKEEGENVLYSILMIKHRYIAGKFEGETFVPGTTESFLEPLKVAFREKRCILREFSYDGNKPGGLDGQIEQAKQQADQSLSQITRWCQAHYGEVYAGWIHLKIIRGFVESVLRYGLPINFYSCFIEPIMVKEKAVKDALTNTISQLRPELARKKLPEGEEEDEDEENIPYVCQKFNVIGASSVSA